MIVPEIDAYDAEHPEEAGYADDRDRDRRPLIVAHRRITCGQCKLELYYGFMKSSPNSGPDFCPDFCPRCGREYDDEDRKFVEEERADPDCVEDQEEV
jgi:hypothetical protein